MFFKVLKFCTSGALPVILYSENGRSVADFDVCSVFLTLQVSRFSALQAVCAIADLAVFDFAGLEVC